MIRPKRSWLFALILTLPMVALYAGYYFNHSSSITPTGFINYDNVTYVAHAKEYLDRDKFHLFYSNPFNDSVNYPAIYFQPQTLILAFLLFVGFAPGFAIFFLNWLGTLLSFRTAIAIYDHLYTNTRNRKLFISFFCWGGGLLALTGVPVALLKNKGQVDFFDRIFFIDPGWGWWGLNFGRGHFNSTEGLFHFLFLAGILCILKKKWNLSLMLALLLSLCHPFTGIEYLAIVVGWVFVEKFFVKNKAIPWSLLIGVSFLMFFHIFYYLIYLNEFPEHRSVSQQFTLNWRLRFFSMIPAYCIVGALAIASWFKSSKDFFNQPSIRLFFCWFVIAFFLANHELFIRPVQPLHFTRGYVWASLFLLGLPALHHLFQNKTLKNYKLALLIFSCLLFSDNFLWITNNVRFTAMTPSVGYLTTEQRDVLKIIERNSDNKTLIIGSDDIPYLCTVYTKGYPWFSHPYTTPFAAKKKAAYNDFIKNNVIDSLWKERTIIFIFRKDDAHEVQRSQSISFPTETIANTSGYIIDKAFISGK